MAAALALVLFGVVTWINDEDAGGGTETGETADGVASHGDGLGSADEAGDAGVAVRENDPVPLGGDAGVGRRLAAGPSPVAVDPDARQLRARAEAQQSAGWRLGATRRRIEVLSNRLDEMNARVAEFESTGRAELAERQRGVIERFDTRLEELREMEGQLATRAAEDGSADDEQTGYDEAEPNRRSAAAGRPGEGGAGAAAVSVRP